MRTALRCIESIFFINFYGMLMKSELQYLSLYTIYSDGHDHDRDCDLDRDRRSFENDRVK